MKKRFVLLILAASVLLTTLVGCGKKEETVVSPPKPDPYWLQINRNSGDSTSNNSSSNNSSSISDSPSATPITPAEPESPKVDTAAVQDELNYLSKNRPKLMIDCPTCGGSGRESVPCSACGGSGQTLIPGVTMFAAYAPCSSCRGNGYAVCQQCTLGLVTNPNYESDSEAWTERRHELWSLLGYSEDEIHRMEIEEAQALLGNDSSSGDSYSGGYNDGSTSIQTSPGVCRACYGSGKCHNCGGDGLYQNMFTGEQIACPNCTNGVCWKCDGTGLDS